MTNLDADSKIHHPDQHRQVQIGDLNIVGDFGPNVVISSGSMTAINIAGGKADGDVYQVISEGASFDQVEQIINKTNLSEEKKDELRQAVTRIRDEIEKDQPDDGLVYLLLATIGNISPETLRVFTDWIIRRTETPQTIRAAAQSARRVMLK